MPVGSHRDESGALTAAKQRVRMPKHRGLDDKIKLKVQEGGGGAADITDDCGNNTTLAGKVTTIVSNKRMLIVLQGIRTFL